MLWILICSYLSCKKVNPQNYNLWKWLKLKTTLEFSYQRSNPCFYFIKTSVWYKGYLKIFNMYFRHTNNFNITINSAVVEPIGNVGRDLTSTACAVCLNQNTVIMLKKIGYIKTKRCCPPLMCSNVLFVQKHSAKVICGTDF